MGKIVGKVTIHPTLDCYVHIYYEFSAGAYQDFTSGEISDGFFSCPLRARAIFVVPLLTFIVPYAAGWFPGTNPEFAAYVTKLWIYVFAVSWLLDWLLAKSFNFARAKDTLPARCGATEHPASYAVGLVILGHFFIGLCWLIYVTAFR